MAKLRVIKWLTNYSILDSKKPRISDHDTKLLKYFKA